MKSSRSDLTKIQARNSSLPLIIAIGYILVIYLLSLRSVCLDLDDVDFGYASAFLCSEIFGYAWLPLLQIIGILIGFNILGPIKQTIIKLPKLSLGFRLQNSTLAFLSLLVIVAIFSFYAVTAIENLQLYEVGTNEIQREVGGKGASFLVLVSGCLSIINLHTKKYSLISFALVCLTSLLFSWFDGSRTAILPFLVYTYYYASQRKWKLSLSMASMSAFLSVLAISSRFIGDKSLDSLLIVLDEVFSSLSSINLAYLFQHSFLHLIYVIDQTPYQFNVNDLLYSIIPLPSSFHFINADPDLWRVDYFRPMGAMGELFAFSPAAFILFNSVYGILIYKATQLNNLYARLITSCIILTSFAMGYQYGLRTVQWLIYLSIALIFSCRDNGKVHNQEV